jgi:hypothetical protein
MKKEEFLELAGKVFDQISPVENDKIVLDKNVWEEIVDQISSEINDLGRDLVENYELEMYSNEVTLENVTLDYGEITKTVSNVIGRYFKRN